MLIYRFINVRIFLDYMVLGKRKKDSCHLDRMYKFIYSCIYYLQVFFFLLLLGSSAKQLVSTFSRQSYASKVHVLLRSRQKKATVSSPRSPCKQTIVIIVDIFCEQEEISSGSYHNGWIQVIGKLRDTRGQLSRITGLRAVLFSVVFKGTGGMPLHPFEYVKHRLPLMFIEG